MADTTILTKDVKKMLSDWAKESAVDKEEEYVETGNIGFDLAVTNGRGLPVGSSLLLWADPGCGKTTVVGDVIRRLLTKYRSLGTPFKVLYLDTENSKHLLMSMGLAEFRIDGSLIYIDKQLCWRNVETCYEAVLNNFDKFKDVKLIVIDSLTNILSDQNMQKSCADGDFGTKARERASFYSKYLMRCKERGITSIFISQARTKQDAGMYEDSKKAAVSRPDLHNVEVILKCGRKSSKTDSGKVATSTAFGKDVEECKFIFTMTSASSSGCKNRFWDSKRSEILMEKGKGADNSYALRKLLEAAGCLKSAGGWYTFTGSICKDLEMEDTKFRLKNLNDVLQKRIAEFVEYLKGKGQYEIKSLSEIVETDEDSEVGEDLEDEE